ncbi:MAG TPA: site-specific DNA-methyltransferase [Solirubrobacteraceae bacterium]
MSRGRDIFAAAISRLWDVAASGPTASAADRSADIRFKLTRIDAYDGLGRLAPASVDLVCTSPPYWGHRTYDQDHNDHILDAWRSECGERVDCPTYQWYRDHGGVLGLEPYPEWYIAHLVEIFARAKAALRPDGNMWINLGDTYFGRWSSIRPRGRQGLAGDGRSRRRTPSGGWLHDKQLLMLPARFAIGMQDDGWILRNDVIWAKPHVAPRPERDRLRLSHEHFFHFVQRTKGGRPSYFYDLAGAEDGTLDVISVQPRSGGNGHPATFPRDLVAPRVMSSSPPGGVVVDPFCGAGTTLAVAVEEGRHAIGFDVSQSYVNVANAYLAGIGAHATVS